MSFVELLPEMCGRPLYIYLHHIEIAANGILFNNIYEQPYICLDDFHKTSIVHLINGIANELKSEGFRRDEVLVSYLKILLVTATRIKLEQQPLKQIENNNEKQQFVIQNLENAIENNFKSKHSVIDYADLLN